MMALSATTSFGQMKVGSAPQPLTGCINDPTHPLAGVPYNYKAVVNPGTEISNGGLQKMLIL